MPAKSKKMRKAAAIAEHNPEALFERNKGLLDMNKNQLSEFASTKEKGLPVKAPQPEKKEEKKSKGGVYSNQKMFEKMRERQGAKKW